MTGDFNGILNSLSSSNQENIDKKYFKPIEATRATSACRQKNHIFLIGYACVSLLKLEVKIDSMHFLFFQFYEFASS